MDRPKANAQQHSHGGRSATRRYLGSCPPGASGASRDDLAPASRHDSGPAGVARLAAWLIAAAGQQPPPAHRVWLRAAAAWSLHAGAGNGAASLGLGARCLVHGRATQGRPGAADADPTAGRCRPRHWPLDAGHRPGGSRGDWRRHGSDDRSAAHLDPLSAAPGRNRFVKTVVPFLRGLAR